jgi:type VI secretion system FHA domain protein
MILTLEIAGPREKTPTADVRKAFDVTGGTIGRLSDNTWVLPDPYVSGHHAKIRYANGAFQIEDTNSANGVFINSPQNRLVRGQPYVLKPGDRVLIEPYEINVSIESVTEDPFGAPPLPNPFDVDSLGASSRPIPEPLDPFGPPPIIGDQEVDPLKLLGGGGGTSPAPDRNVRRPEQPPPSPLRNHYSVPSPVEPENEGAANARAIPTGYNPLVDHVPPAKPARPAPPPPADESPRPPKSVPKPQVPSPHSTRKRSRRSSRRTSAAFCKSSCRG